MAKEKEMKYEDLCTPGKVRDPNTGKLVNCDAEFEKRETPAAPEEKKK